MELGATTEKPLDGLSQNPIFIEAPPDSQVCRLHFRKFKSVLLINPLPMNGHTHTHEFLAICPENGCILVCVCMYMPMCLHTCVLAYMCMFMYTCSRFVCVCVCMHVCT